MISKFNAIQKVIFSFVLLLILQSSVKAQLTANFSVDKSGGCSPLSVSFTNTTTGATSSAVYKWDLGNSNISTQFNCAAIYTTEKKYSVTLTVTDGSQSSSKTQQITVYDKPVLDFAVATAKVCIPDAASFTATASVTNGSISSYFWDFGDGSTQQSFSNTQLHNYTAVQTATVNLTAVSSMGCSNTISKPGIVQIFPSINLAFSADQNILCKVTDVVKLTNTSTGPSALSYLWDFGDGTTSTLTNPSHSFGIKGIYTVKLKGTSQEGCVATITQNNFINVASYKSDFSIPSPICSGNYTYFNFSGTPQPTSSTWILNNVVQPYYNYTSFSTQFANSGNYSLQLNNMFGSCPDSVIKIITVNKTPNVGFIADIVNKCGAPTVVNFKDTTQGVTVWNWNIYNGNNTNITSTIPNPSVNYSVNGNYWTTLTVSTAAGCSAYISKYINIAAPTVSIQFTPVNVCGPFSISFSTTIQNDSITNYNWDFNDGSFSSDPKPSHNFNHPGTYYVKLTYTTKNGCTGIVVAQPIYENERPNISFSASPTTTCGTNPVYFPIVFNGQANGYIPYYSWNFGDNTGGGTPPHSYNKEGIFDIVLYASFGACGDTTITKPAYVTVKPPFPAITAVLNTCNGTRGEVTFVQKSVGATTVTWNFGDGSAVVTTAGNQDTIRHTYNATGNYTATLTAINNSCTLSVSRSVFVLLKQHPVLASAQTSICSSGTISIDASSFETNPQSSSYPYSPKFEYADGSAFTGNFYITNPQYGYNWQNKFSGTLSNFAEGQKDIRMISTSAYFGCADTSNFIPLTVKGAKAFFSILNNNACYKTPLIFKDSSIATFGNTILKWEWNFGDGTTVTNTNGSNVSHQYTNPGYYNVQLRIYDAANCVSTSQYTYYSNGAQATGPKAIFNVSDNNPTITQLVYFYNYTNTYNSNNTSYSWNFGDGTTSTDAYPAAHAYSIPGTYIITLIATNILTGCIDSTALTIVVKNFRPAFSFTKNDIALKGCPPVLVRFSNDSYNYNKVSWDFGDGTTAGNINYPSHIYSNAGKYYVTLYVYNQQGVSGIYKDSIIITAPVPGFVFDPKKGCIGQAVTFTGNSGAASYIWDFGDGNVLNANAVSTHTFNVAGVFYPTFLQTDINGCNAAVRSSENIVINSNPTLTFAPVQPVVCLGTPTQLTASGAATYSWSPAAGLNKSDISSPLASPTVSTTYTVIAKDAEGCQNQASIYVKVVNPFTLVLTGEVEICKNNSVQIIASGAATYKWINNTTGLSNTDIANPYATPSITTLYTVQGKDDYNCFTATANITVKVLPLPSVTTTQVPTLSLGESVQFKTTASSDVIAWSWNPKTFLSCDNCAEPICTPLVETKYIVTVKNQNGCAASDSVEIKINCTENSIYIPNAFTPNRDGKNDYFVIIGAQFINKLIIYDRYGFVVFEKSNFYGNTTEWWDGNFKGVPASPGVYVYMAEIKCPIGTSFIKKGTVLLVR